MTNVVAPIKVKVEHFSSPKLNEATERFHQHVLFIDLAHPEGSKQSRIWKILSDVDCKRLTIGSVVYLVPSGLTKLGSETHNIVLEF